MDGVTGGDIPAKIWHDFVIEAEKIMTKPAAARSRQLGKTADARESDECLRSGPLGRTPARFQDPACPSEPR